MTVDKELQNKKRVQELINTLRSDTRNIDLWLELEKLFNDPTRKREILMGILVIDAENRVAQKRLQNLSVPKPTSETKPENPDLPRLSQLIPKEEPAEQVQPAALKGESIQTLEYKTEETEAPTGFKNCPCCGELIRMDAIKCRFCQEILKKENGNGWEPEKTRKKKEEFPKWLKFLILAFIIVGSLAVVAMLIWLGLSLL